MAESRLPIEPPKPWEILGAFFGYFAVAKDVPSILRTLGLTKLVPDSIVTKLVEWNPYPDFWLLLLFTGLTVTLVVVFLPRKSTQTVTQDKDKLEESVRRAIKRGKAIRIIKNLGLNLVREKLLDFMSVSLYGTFKRQTDWPKAPDRTAWIDRITFNDGRGIEYQYSRNFENLSVREHPSNSDTYGQPTLRPPKKSDIWLMLVASNRFPFWFLGYVLKKCWKRIIRLFK